MKFTVERNWIDVVGGIWMPYGSKCAMRYDLHSYELECIGKPTRKNVERWIGTHIGRFRRDDRYVHSGDFSSIEDYRAVIGEKEFKWKKEESECIFNDCVYGDSE